MSRSRFFFLRRAVVLALLLIPATAGRARANPGHEAICQEISARPNSTPQERAELSVLLWASRCPEKKGDAAALAFSVFGRTAEFPSHLTRFGYFSRCLNSGSTNQSFERLMSAETVAFYAACRFLAPELSRDKLAAELEGAKLSESIRLEVLSAFDGAVKLFTWLDQEYNAHFGKKKELKEALFDLPKAAYDRALTAIAREREALNTAITFADGMLDARAHQAKAVAYAEGCGDKLRPLVAGHLSAVFKRERVKNSETAFRAMANPVSQNLIPALEVCLAAEGDAHSSKALELLGRGAPQAAGPYLAAFDAAEQAFTELKDAGKPILFKFESYPIRRQIMGFPHGLGQEVRALFGREPDVVGHWSFWDRPTDGGNKSEAYFEGQIASVKDEGARVRLVFARNDWKTYEYRCANVKPLRLSHWEVKNGRRVPVYTQTCSKVGGLKRSFQPGPVLVPKWAAAGLAKGAVVRYLVPGEHHMTEKERQGFIAEVWANKSKKKLVATLGAKL